MSKYIDLHVHTKASDGTLSPSEVVNRAKKMDLAVIAITDHDTMAGIPEALKEADKVGIEVLPGIEISVEYEPELHILGYFPGNSYLNLQNSLLKKLQKAREIRNNKVINRLNELGIDISMDELEEEASGDIIGRPHIATVLKKKGYVNSVRDAFDKYLSVGAPAYFSKAKLTPQEGIMQIADAGGIPVMAHPLTLGYSYEELNELLAELKKIGLKGIEAYYTEHTINDTIALLELAKKNELLVTGGSDFHGEVKPEIEIGRGYGNLFIPFELFEALLR
ncbi:MAG TPA: PHP domain-containing protein [Clostridiaceae bacterium]|nr:PHP domain-containing protein [Clostridiaceae bacterium]